MRRENPTTLRVAAAISQVHEPFQSYLPIFGSGFGLGGFNFGRYSPEVICSLEVLGADSVRSPAISGVKWSIEAHEKLGWKWSKSPSDPCWPLWSAEYV